MYVLKTEDMQLPLKIWAEKGSIEEHAMQQIKNLSNLPFAYKHIAICPDCHSGYGMPIGAVLATKGVVLPFAVGSDIGCGMCAVKTSLKANQIDKETIKKIMGRIREAVPVGFEHHKETQPEGIMPIFKCVRGDESFAYPVSWANHDSALKQLGTLGGGNHFIEIQKDTEDNIWIMIHSGSRNLGKKVADRYNEIAVELNKKWYSTIPKEWELAFLPIDSEEAKCYMLEMQYCVDFALANRKLMMDRIISCFIEIIQKDFWLLNNKDEVVDLDNSMINIAHNYAAWENHFGKNVIVHRKGATLAREGTIGIIPGSQGTNSYIVKGKGNPDSFNSCSHGAGRRMGRKQAQRELNLEAEKKKLDDQGIIHAIRNNADLDEAAGAYKDIYTVMENQSDLVDIVAELTPLGVIKA